MELGVIQIIVSFSHNLFTKIENGMLQNWDKIFGQSWELPECQLLLWCKDWWMSAEWAARDIHQLENTFCPSEPLTDAFHQVFFKFKWTLSVPKTLKLTTMWCHMATMALRGLMYVKTRAVCEWRGYALVLKNRGKWFATHQLTLLPVTVGCRSYHLKNSTSNS
jgi:hypothetical protein